MRDLISFYFFSFNSLFISTFLFVLTSALINIIIIKSIYILYELLRDIFAQIAMQLINKISTQLALHDFGREVCSLFVLLSDWAYSSTIFPGFLWLFSTICCFFFSFTESIKDKVQKKLSLGITDVGIGNNAVSTKCPL